MRPRKLAPILTAAAVVLGASSAVFAAEGGPALFTLAAEEPGVEDPVDGGPAEPEEQNESETRTEPEALTEPEELVEDSAEPEALTEPEELVEEPVVEELDVAAENAESGSDEQSDFSAWVENFDDPNCHRGQTIANVARRGPESFTDFDSNDCVPLEGWPGNRGTEDDDRGRPDGVGPPSNAGPPAGSGAPDHAGPPPHAFEAGRPDHADRPADAGPPDHARSRHNRNDATAESDVTEVERDDTE